MSHSPQRMQALGDLDIASLIQSGADAYKSYSAAKKPAAAPVQFAPAPARDAAPASSPWKTIAIVGVAGGVGLIAVKFMMGRRRNPGRRRSHARRRGRSHRRR